MIHGIYQGVTEYNLQMKIVFLSLKIVFVLTKSVEPDEMPHYGAVVAFQIALQYLPMSLA